MIFGAMESNFDTLRALRSPVDAKAKARPEEIVDRSVSHYRTSHTAEVESVAVLRHRERYRDLDINNRVRQHEFETIRTAASLDRKDQLVYPVGYRQPDQWAYFQEVMFNFPKYLKGWAVSRKWQLSGMALRLGFHHLMRHFSGLYVQTLLISSSTTPPSSNVTGDVVTPGNVLPFSIGFDTGLSICRRVLMRAGNIGLAVHYAIELSKLPSMPEDPKGAPIVDELKRLPRDPVCPTQWLESAAQRVALDPDLLCHVYNFDRVFPDTSLAQRNLRYRMIRWTEEQRPTWSPTQRVDQMAKVEIVLMANQEPKPLE